eukprot:scaffold18676_cov52-Phaeocystis_antarctica.AAC.3
MRNMFQVRSSPCPVLPVCSRALSPAPCLHRGRPPPPASRYSAPRTTPYAPFDSRQGAVAFNQPLSFDTSSVTNMDGMFWVRSSPCPAPNLQSRALPCTLLAPRSPAASRLPTRTLAPHRMCPPFDSAGRVGVQPAAELRHLQRHDHGPHVQRALLPVPCPETAVEPSPARCLCRGRPPPPASRPVCALRSTRQDASAFNQPLSFDTFSVNNMDGMFWVRSSPCPAPNLQSSPPLHAACAAVARRLPPPSANLAQHRMPSF